MVCTSWWGHTQGLDRSVRLFYLLKYIWVLSCNKKVFFLKSTLTIAFALISSGVYPSGADNEMYVDFLYVGGGQNPNADPLPKGSLTFKSYLPNGKYDYRYLYVFFIKINHLTLHGYCWVSECYYLFLKYQHKLSKKSALQIATLANNNNEKAPFVDKISQLKHPLYSHC